MTPDQVLKTLIGLDRRTATIVVGAIAVFAGIAIIRSWQLDLSGTAGFAVFLVGLGAGLYLIAYVVNDPVLKKVLGWFVTLLIICATLALFISTAFPGQTPLAPSYCLVRFWEPCNSPGGVADVIAKQNYTPPSPVSVARPEVTRVHSDEYKVFVQFAGVIVRDDVKSLMNNLKVKGWQVQGVEKGGERTTAAIGFNEIRYSSPKEKAAAELLAFEIQQANIVSKEITVKQTSQVSPRTLEVWISRT